MRHIAIHVCCLSSVSSPSQASESPWSQQTNDNHYRQRLLVSVDSCCLLFCTFSTVLPNEPLKTQWQLYVPPTMAFCPRINNNNNNNNNNIYYFLRFSLLTFLSTSLCVSVLGSPRINHWVTFTSSCTPALVPLRTE